MKLSQTEVSRLRKQMLDFCQRVLAGGGTADELEALPKVLALLVAQEP